MPDYVVYVYTADMFVGGLPAEAVGGLASVPVTAARPYTMTLKADAKPIAITIRDQDTGTVRVDGSNWVTSPTKFDETSLNQHILGGSYHPGESINAAYTMAGATAYNGKPLSIVTYRLGGKGPDTGPVQGLLSTEALIPGKSYTFNSTFTTQQHPDNYPQYYDPTDPPPPCFTSGTQIITCRGPVMIEDLNQGDLVLTMDNGFKPVAWITSRTLPSACLRDNPAFLPVRIGAGALGGGLPERDLLVSPQHRVLIRSRLSERMFAEREVLIAAKHLVGLPGITVDTDATEVTYWHFLLDGHEVVFSNGAPTETLFTGPEAMKTLLPEQRAEILSLFPDCVDVATNAPARPLIQGRRARSFARRTYMSHHALLDPATDYPLCA